MNHQPDFRTQDRLMIQQVLSLYCHAIDRIQLNKLEQVFHRDAQINNGEQSLSRAEFISNVASRHPGVPTAFHMLGNVLIDFLDAHTAFVESYCLALEHHTQTEKGPADRTVRVRYGDIFEQRDGTWKISQRLVVIDHEQAIPTKVYAENLFFGLRGSGSRNNDPLINMRNNAKIEQ